MEKHRRRCALGWLAGALLLLLPVVTEAQYSLTTAVFYNPDTLGRADWRALGRDFVAQGFRGSMALIFPNRAPITDPKEVERWIVEQPIVGFAFPGLNADALGAWSFAKQLALANNQSGGPERPVVAVNSGWTDWGAGVGHMYELGGLRPAVQEGRPYEIDSISTKVADLIHQRVKRTNGRVEPILVAAHSAGGYYGANVAWLLARKGLRYQAPLRVYNLGIAAKLPDRVKAAQFVGTSDMVALANSHSSALASASTRLVGDISHNGGPEWRYTDSFAKRPWKVESMDTLFGRGGPRQRVTRVARGPGGTELLIDALQSKARKLHHSASEARQLADRQRGSSGIGEVIQLKLDHDAKLLELEANRQDVLASLLRARKQGDAAGVQQGRRQLRTLRQQRRTATQNLQTRVQAVRRNMLNDSIDFSGAMATETLASSTPWRLWQKTAQASAMGVRLGTQWMSFWLHNPLLNPLAAWSRDDGGRSTPAAARPRAPLTRPRLPMRWPGPSRR